MLLGDGHGALGPRGVGVQGSRGPLRSVCFKEGFRV